MVNQLKRVLKKSKSAIVAWKVYENWAVKRRFEAGNQESLLGSTHSTVLTTVAQSVDYIFTQFNDYLRYSGLAVEDLEGKRIFELGFGDNVGVGLKFIAAGASEVVGLDKFYSKRDIAHQLEIYKALRERLDEKEKQRFDEAVKLSSTIELNSDRVRCIYGFDVENASELHNGEKFDLIVSRAVIQDLYEPEEAFRAMDRLLKPAGMMLHKIDMSDQGVFRDNGMNPLTFLTIPESIYRRMALDSGQSNRKLGSYYRELMTKLGYQTSIFITNILGVGDVNGGPSPLRSIQLGQHYSESSLNLIQKIRPKLQPKFRDLPDTELLVDGIFLIAKKPVD